MAVRLTALLIILTILGCAMLASYQHKPFELRIDGPDAKPGVWPTDADAPPPPAEMFNTPCEIGPKTVPIVEPERKV